MHIIRDDTLARQLAGWSALIENLAQTEENLRIMVRDNIIPWLQQQTPFPPADSMTSTFPVNVNAMLNSYVFENMVRMLVRQTEAILLDGEPVSAQIDSILERTKGRPVRR